MRKLLLLTNPLFRRHGRRDLPRILSIFRQAGTEVEVHETGAHRAAGAQARRASSEGFDAIVVCGGDGTVFDVLQGVAGSNIPLGIIPFGTGNVLAQNLRIPKDPAAAARWMLSSRPLPVRLGKITCCCAGPEKQSWFFAMSAGMGMHAALLAAARRSAKDRSGRAAYFAAGLRLLLGHPVQLFEAEITTLDGSVIQRRVCEAVAVRVRELNLWRPGGSLDLPFLRLASVEGKSRGRLARAVFDSLFRAAGARGRGSSSNFAARYDDVLRVVCRPIPGPESSTPIPVQADGEVLGASAAEIEMTGVSVQLLSASVPHLPVCAN